MLTAHLEDGACGWFVGSVFTMVFTSSVGVSYKKGKKGSRSQPSTWSRCSSALPMHKHETPFIDPCETKVTFSSSDCSRRLAASGARARTLSLLGSLQQHDVAMATNKRSLSATSDTLDTTTHKAVKREFRIYYENIYSPCGIPEVTRGQVGEMYKSSEEANAVAEEHAAALLEDHSFHEIIKRATSGLYSATVDDGGDGQVDIWVTEGKDIKWKTDEMIQQLKEEAEEEGYDAQEVPLVEEDIEALVRGRGGPSTAHIAAA